MNNIYSNIAMLALGVWLVLHALSTQEIFKVFSALFLFGKWKYTDFDNIFKFLCSKKFEDSDTNYIAKLKVRLNTYIQKYEHKNKGLLNNVITILISSLITVIIAQYTFQSQVNKDLVTQIVSNLNNDYMFAFYWVIGIYGILEELASIKFEYYIFVKNIIHEVEKDKPSEQEHCTSYMKEENFEEIINEENYRIQDDVINKVRAYYINKKLSEAQLKTQLIILKTEELKIRESKLMEFITMMVGIFVAYVAALVGLANDTNTIGVTNRLALVLVGTVVILIIVGYIGFWANDKINIKRNNRKIDLNIHKSVIEELLEEIKKKDRINIKSLDTQTGIMETFSE